MAYSIGVDVGASKISVALVKGRKIIKKITKPTSNKGRSYVLKILEDSIREILNKKVNGIGIGFPGTMKNGTILKTPNLKGWKNFQLKKHLEKKFGLKTYLINDVIAMALGEKIYGAAKPYKNIVCLAIGTGLGGAIIIDNKIYYGKGNAGELGHMVIIEDGHKCGCGNKGCIEQYVSSMAIARDSKKIFNKILDPITIEKMARKGNKKAKKIYENLGYHLGTGIVSLNNILDPELIIIGGGIAHAKDLFMKEARRQLKRSLNELPKIKFAKLKKDAGVIGASCLVKGGKK